MCQQVTVMRSYDIMIGTARRQTEGALIYILDRNDLYLRVRDGVRQVMVWFFKTHNFLCTSIYLFKMHFMHERMLTILFYDNISELK